MPPGDHGQGEEQGWIVKRIVAVVAGVGTVVMGVVVASPGVAITPAATLSVASAKQYIVVRSAEVAKDRRSVSGEISWHTKTLKKGVNRFTVWAGVDDGSQQATTLGQVELRKKKLDKRGRTGFVITWGTRKAKKVGRAKSIRISATQRFDRAGTSGQHERAMFQTVEVKTGAKRQAPVMVQGPGCAASDLHKGADLKGCTFEGLNLQRVNLESSNLADAQFINCNLKMASIQESRGHNPKFFYNNLYQADFTAAEFDRASFGGNIYTNSWMFYTDLSHATFSPVPKGADVPITDTGTKCWPDGHPGPCTFTYM